MAAAKKHHHQVLPPTDTLIHVLSRYVDIIHPQIPFLNLEGFAGNIQAAVTRGHLSLFVLVTMLATAFPYADDVFAVMAGFESSRRASMRYFRLAEIIHQQEIEQDPIALASGFLLLSTCSGSKSTDWYEQKHRCIAKAKHFLQVANVHSDADKDRVAPARNAKMRRRLAWCCFVQERIIAMSAVPLKPLPPAEKSITQTPMICHSDFQFRPILSTFYGLRSPLLQDTLAQMCVAYLFKLRVYVCCILMGQPPAQLHKDKRLWQGLEAQIIAWYTSFLDMFRSQAMLGDVQRCLVIQWESLVLLYQTVKLRSLHDSWSAVNFRTHGLSWAQSTFQSALATWETMKKVFVNLDQRERLFYIPEGAVALIYPAVLCMSRLRNLPYSGFPNAGNLDPGNSLASLLEALEQRFSGVDNVVAAIREMLATQREAETEEPSLPTPQSDCHEIKTVSDSAADTVCLSDLEIRQLRRCEPDQNLPQLNDVPSQISHL